jgi:hypothetical protein
VQTLHLWLKVRGPTVRSQGLKGARVWVTWPATRRSVLAERPFVPAKRMLPALL